MSCNTIYSAALTPSQTSLSCSSFSSTSHLQLARNGYGFLHFPISMARHYHRKKYMIVANTASDLQPEAPPSLPAPFNSAPVNSGRKGWIAGITATVLVPLLSFLVLKRQVDSALQTAEDAVKVVEKAAEGVEKAAEGLAEKLPDGQLKSAATLVERVAKETAKDFHLVDAAINKVQELEEKAEGYVKPSSWIKGSSIKGNETAEIKDEQAQ